MTADPTVHSVTEWSLTVGITACGGKLTVLNVSADPKGVTCEKCLEVRGLLGNNQAGAQAPAGVPHGAWGGSVINHHIGPEPIDTSSFITQAGEANPNPVGYRLPNPRKLFRVMDANAILDAIHEEGFRRANLGEFHA